MNCNVHEMVSIKIMVGVAVSFAPEDAFALPRNVSFGAAAVPKSNRNGTSDDDHRESGLGGA